MAGRSRADDSNATTRVVSKGATPRKHIVRKGALARLPKSVQALLCPCEVCVNLVERAELRRGERNRRNRHLHPLCQFCGAPTIWREILFVCPYSTTAELHREVRDINRPELEAVDGEEPWTIRSGRMLSQ